MSIRWSKDCIKWQANYIMACVGVEVVPLLPTRWNLSHTFTAFICMWLYMILTLLEMGGGHEMWWPVFVAKGYPLGSCPSCCHLLKPNFKVWSLSFQKRPPDNSVYVRTCSKNPKDTNWWYHGECHQFSLCEYLQIFESLARVHDGISDT